jgi:hypothetical protein
VTRSSAEEHHLLDERSLLVAQRPRAHRGSDVLGGHRGSDFGPALGGALEQLPFERDEVPGAEATVVQADDPWVGEEPVRS